jgi:hypothetical protein
MKLANPFIRLPFKFDASKLKEEIACLDNSTWMPHPLNLAGNFAVALISREGNDNDEFGGVMKTTSHLEKCPYHQQVMSSFDEVLARSRLMKLDAGCEISSHVDFNYHWFSRVRIHIPIITNPDVIFYCGDEELNMRAGDCWIFDNWRRHRVTNNSDQNRIHLVIDLAGSSRFWRMVRDVMQYNPEDEAGFDALARTVKFEPDQQVSISTEKYNISPVMSPGEINSLVNSVIADFDNHPDNDPQLSEQYKILLTDFSSDWREIWHQHGIQPEGIPQYRQLIDRVTRSLHPNRRALITGSNEIGVNPIIMQRILGPALAINMYDQFIKGVED